MALSDGELAGVVVGSFVGLVVVLVLAYMFWRRMYTKSNKPLEKTDDDNDNKPLENGDDEPLDDETLDKTQSDGDDDDQKTGGEFWSFAY